MSNGTLYNVLQRPANTHQVLHSGQGFRGDCKPVRLGYMYWTPPSNTPVRFFFHLRLPEMDDDWYFPTTIGLQCTNLVSFWSRTLWFALSPSLRRSLSQGSQRGNNRVWI